MIDSEPGQGAREGQPSVAAEDFKAGMRQLAAAVNVITVAHNGDRQGLTATSACSVSSEPPQLLICVNRDAGAHELISAAGAFCLNVLARDQEDIARRFAGMDGSEKSRRFDLGTWTGLTTGAPVLEGCVANFDCRITNAVDAASHTIFIGRVVAVRSDGDEPLLFGGGDFTAMANSGDPA